MSGSICKQRCKRTSPASQVQRCCRKKAEEGGQASPIYGCKVESDREVARVEDWQVHQAASERECRHEAKQRLRAAGKAKRAPVAPFPHALLLLTPLLPATVPHHVGFAGGCAMNPEGRPERMERCRLVRGDWREWRRLRAWDLKQQGWRQRDIAEAFGVTEVAVSRWMALARQGGRAALLTSPSPGAPRRLTDQDYRRLEELLAEGATAHGWHNNLWTTGRVAHVIQTHFGVRYHPAHVSRILKGQLNWTCQRPVHHHKDRNDAAIARWVRESFPRILETATARGLTLSLWMKRASCLNLSSGAPMHPVGRPLYIASGIRMAGSRRLAR